MASKPSDDEFEWDVHNIDHLAKHRISPSEAEYALRNDPVFVESEQVDGEDRWRVVSSTAALRVLILVFTVRMDRIRVVTGWDADKGTKRKYWGKKGN